MIPKLAIMAAMSTNRVIGYQNKLPWYLPADLARVSQIAAGKTFIMGKQTYLSPDVILSPIKNIILSKSPITPLHLPSPQAFQATSFNQALSMLQANEQVLIMGGASVYTQALHVTHCMYLTVVHETFHGDAFFPKWDESQWELVHSEDYQANAENPHKYSFLEYVRLDT